MIHFQIIDSPDLLSIGDYNFSLQHITIGRSLGQTLPIDDSSIEKEHLILKTTMKQLIVSSEAEFLVNNKMVKGTINLKLNDKIQIGQTLIQIINFDFKHSLDPNLYHETLRKVGESDPQLLMLIEKLEVLYVDLLGE